MGLETLEAGLEGLVDSMLSPGRARHSRAVAALSGHLAGLHGLEPLRARVAGLAHDICKEMDGAEQEALARLYSARKDRPLPSSGLIGRAIVHGPAAAGHLLTVHGLEDEDILEAVALHTIGDRAMGDLARIVYAADKIEPGRRHVTEDFRRRCELLPPRELFAEVLESTMDWMRAQGRPVAAETLALHESLRATGSRA